MMRLPREFCPAWEGIDNHVNKENDWNTNSLASSQAKMAEESL